MGNITSQEFDEIMVKCKDIFVTKMKDYGSAWRVLRTSSLTDQIYIKANRIRSIENKGVSKVDEGIIPEFIGIVNYSVMAQIQLEIGTKDDLPENINEMYMDAGKVEIMYDKYVSRGKALMENKNHDYGEAWRNMRVSSLTDIILMKLMRVKQIEDNKGETYISEGVDANYYDIFNYAVFALIKLMIK